MTVIPLGDFSGRDDVRKAIGQVAERTANELVAQHHSGEAPSAYLEYVDSTVREAVIDALDMTGVLDLDEYGADQELEDRVALDRERSWSA